MPQLRFGMRCASCISTPIGDRRSSRPPRGAGSAATSRRPRPGSSTSRRWPRASRSAQRSSADLAGGAVLDEAVFPCSQAVFRVSGELLGSFWGLPHCTLGLRCARKEPSWSSTRVRSTARSRWQRSGRTPWISRECRPSRPSPVRLPRTFRATAILIGLAFGVAVYGVAAGRDARRRDRPCGRRLAVVAMARGARARRSERWSAAARCLGALGRSPSAPATTWRSRTRSWSGRNADLEAQHAAIFEGFDWIDERTAGRLRDLLEEAGDELAELADDGARRPWEDA